MESMVVEIIKCALSDQ